MKQQDQKQYAGVWLDNQKAIIIAAENGNAEYAIQDKIKAAENHTGGSEHTINNARQSDMIKYFKSISTLLHKYDKIHVFGPGKSQEQFLHHLQEDVQFKNKKITIDSAEQLTDPQMIAKVRDHFN